MKKRSVRPERYMLQTMTICSCKLSTAQLVSHVHTEENLSKLCKSMQWFARENCKRIERALFYDVLLRKCEKCGAGTENSHSHETFWAWFWSIGAASQWTSWKLHEKLKYQACNSTTFACIAKWPTAAIETSFMASLRSCLKTCSSVKTTWKFKVLKMSKKNKCLWRYRVVRKLKNFCSTGRNAARWVEIRIYLNYKIFLGQLFNGMLERMSQHQATARRTQDPPNSKEAIGNLLYERPGELETKRYIFSNRSKQKN